MMICPVCGDERTCEDCIAYFAAPKPFTEEERAGLDDLCIKFPGKPAETFQRYEATVRVLAERARVAEQAIRDVRAYVYDTMPLDHLSESTILEMLPAVTPPESVDGD